MKKKLIKSAILVPVKVIYYSYFLLDSRQVFTSNKNFFFNKFRVQTLFTDTCFRSSSGSRTSFPLIQICIKGNARNQICNSMFCSRDPDP